MAEVASWFISPERAALAGVVGTSHVSEGFRHSWRLSGAGYQALKWDEGVQTAFFWKNSVGRIAVQMLANQVFNH